MTRLEIHLDAETLKPIIQAAVDAAVRRLQDERARDDDGQVLWDKPRTGEEMGGVSESTVDRWRKEAGLPFVKIDGKVLFRPSALEAWAAARESKEGDE